MKEKLGAFGIVAAAALASSCCWGPLILAASGAAGVGFAAILAPYRPYFIAVTSLLLVGAWFVVLTRRANPSDCCSPSAGREEAAEVTCGFRGKFPRNVVLLSAVTISSILLLSFPKIEAAVLSGGSAHRPLPTGTAGLQSFSLHVRGWSCEACGVEVEKRLLKVPGVVAAHADYSKGSVRVLVRPGIRPEQPLRDAVSRLGYSLTSISPRS